MKERIMEVKREHDRVIMAEIVLNWKVLYAVGVIHPKQGLVGLRERNSGTWWVSIGYFCWGKYMIEVDFNGNLEKKRYDYEGEEDMVLGWKMRWGTTAGMCFGFQYWHI